MPQARKVDRPIRRADACPLRDKHQALRKSRGRHAAARDQDAASEGERGPLARCLELFYALSAKSLSLHKVSHSRCPKPLPAAVGCPDPHCCLHTCSKHDAAMFHTHAQLPSHCGHPGESNLWSLLSHKSCACAVQVDGCSMGRHLSTPPSAAQS